MAIQKSTDAFQIVQTAGDTYQGNDADQIYQISPTLTGAGDVITIIDQGGSNTVELAGGLTIASSIVTSNEAQLVLSNGAIINIRGADTFTFAVGANTAAGQTGVDKTFSEFATDVLNVALPAEGDAAVTSNDEASIETGGNVVIVPEDPNAPTYALTEGAASVDEGATATFTLATTNVAEGTEVAYTITGVDAADVDGGSLTGTATVGADGSATISVVLLADATTEGDETLTVTIDGQTATASSTVTDSSIAVDEDFLLTTSNDDVLSGTAGNDQFVAELGTLQTGDIVLDSSNVDDDTLTAAVSNSSTEARIQNVETLNITGEYVTAGLSLTEIVGTKTINVDTLLPGSTAAFTGSTTLAAEAINLGANIETLNVTSSSSGTFNTVAIDANAAATVTLTGQASGSDKYSIDVAKSTSLTLSTFASSGDEVTVTAAGDFTLKSANGNTDDTLALTISSSEAAVINIGDNDTTAIADKVTLTGSADITLHGDDLLQVQNVLISDESTGTSTLKMDDIDAATADFSDAQVDVVVINSVGTSTGSTVTVNENSSVNLIGDYSTDANLKLNLDDADPDNKVTFSAGTLILNVSEDQGGSNAIQTDDNVETLILEATPDETADTDVDNNGSKENKIDIASLDVDNDTDVVVVRGAEDLLLTKVVTNHANRTDDLVISASNMTGNLTISEVDNDATIQGGSGSDSIALGSTGAGDLFSVRGGDGADTLNMAGAANDSEVYGDAGNDTITLSDNDITVDAGAGDDTVSSGQGVNSVTLGSGSDTYYLNAGDAVATTANSTEIKDFTSGEDTLVLHGATTGDINLASVTVSDAVYALDNDGAGTAFKIKLTGNSATDMSDNIQLGYTSSGSASSTAYKAADGTTIIAGSKNDVISVGDNDSVTITTGSGSDMVVLVNDKASNNDTVASVTDFTKGSDRIVLEGSITDNESADLTNQTADSDGQYAIGDNDFEFTMKSGGVVLKADDGTALTNLTSHVQLGSASANFVVDLAAGATADVIVRGGVFNDYVTLNDTAAGTDGINANFEFASNGGVDTITLSTADNDTTISFDEMQGITATSGTAHAGDAKVSDATDGAVYVFANSTVGASGSKISTFEADSKNGVTADTILTDVAAYLDANLGSSDGESYIAIINDESTTVYENNLYGSATVNHDAYVYLVTADADGIQSDDVQLIGQIITATPGTTAVSIADIA